MKIFRDFLLIIKRKISFSALSMEELIHNSTENEFSALLSVQLRTKNPPQAFSAVTQDFFKINKDSELALAFFSEFGRADIVNQLQSIEMYIGVFNSKIAEAEASYKEKFKVNIMLYSFIGVAVTLVLI